MNHSYAPMMLVGVAVVVTGCASHNYDFASLPEGKTRVSLLASDLERLHDSENTDDTLYDFSVIPLVHSRLHTFSESDETEGPAGFIEADVESSLPLFGFVTGEVSQYDEAYQLIARHEFDSALWGAFRDHREVVVTHAGMREQTRHTFLWIFSWSGEEKWHPVDHFQPRSEARK